MSSLPLSKRDPRLATSGVIGEPLIPSCPICGLRTDRLDMTDRRCGSGHMSRIHFTSQPHGRMDRWSLVAL